MIFASTFDQASNWAIDQRGTDTATGGQFEIADPEQTRATNSINGRSFQMQPGNDSRDSGSRALISGPSAGAAVYSHDIDNGTTSAWSPIIVLPAGNAPVMMSFDYYLAHQVNSSTHDYLRVVVSELGSAGNPTQVFRASGSPLRSRSAEWRSVTNIDLTAFRGRAIQVGVEARDIGTTDWVPGVAGNASTKSLVEAGFDNLIVAEVTTSVAPPTPPTPTPTATPRPPSGAGSFTFDFEDGSNWAAASPNSASSGRFEVGTPQRTALDNLQLQPGRASGGTRALVTGPAAGSSAGANDVDGGVTSVRSPSFRISPSAGDRVEVTGRFFFGHTSSSVSGDDYLQLILVVGNQRFEVFRLDGTGANRGGYWATFRTQDISAYAGRTGYFLYQASDTGSGSILEAGLDDLTVRWN